MSASIIVFVSVYVIVFVSCDAGVPVFRCSISDKKLHSDCLCASVFVTVFVYWCAGLPLADVAAF